MIFGLNSYGKSLRRIGSGSEKSKKWWKPRNISKFIFFQTCLKIIPRDLLHTLKARKHLKACFWAWLRSLKPKKHPWMARRHSNSWIVSLNISDANGTGFSGYPTRVPGRPQVVFNRFTDSYPKPRFAAPGPAWPSMLMSLYSNVFFYVANPLRKQIWKYPLITCLTVV